MQTLLSKYQFNLTQVGKQSFHTFTLAAVALKLARMRAEIRYVSFLVLLPFSLFANMEQIEQLYQLSLDQTENNQFIIHNDHLLFPHPYVKKLRFKAISSLQGAEVIYSGKIGDFNKLSDWGGVHIHTADKTYLQFNLRYYEHLQDIGEGGSFYAICDLPTYTNCILLGCENNPDDENCY